MYNFFDYVVLKEMGNVFYMSFDEKFDNKLIEDVEEDSVYKNIVYFIFDLLYIFDRFELGIVYIIGGLVDCNREKGFCYKRV